MPSTETKHLTSLNFDLTQMQQQLASIPATVEQAAKNAQDAWNNNFNASGGTGSGATGGGSGDGAGAEMSATQSRLESLMLSYKNFQATLANSKLEPAELQKLRTAIDTSIDSVERLTGSFVENGKLAKEESAEYRQLISTLKELKGAYADVKTDVGDAQKGTQGETIITATKSQLESLSLQYKNFETTLSKSNIYPESVKVLREQAASAITEIDALTGKLDENGNITGGNAKKFQDLTSNLKDSKGAFAELKTEANDAAGMMKKTGEATDQAGTGIRNFLGKLADKARWLAAFYLIQGIINGFKALITTVKETETTVVELQRVLNENVSSEKISSELYAIASEYGRTFAEVQESAVLFAQTGKSWDDVLTLTRGTMLALNTAELDVTQATQGLIAVMAQWNLGADDYVGLIDKINITADNFAITSEKIVAALQRSGGTAKAYGMTLEELIGVITALGEATGRSGENLGTAINSLITYTTKAKSIDVFKKMGIDAEDAEGKLLPILDIWAQLAQKIKGGDLAFADFLATDDAAIDEFLADSEEYQQLVAQELANGKEIQSIYSAAGTFRKNYFIALLNNLGTAEEAVRGMTDAEGHSVTENERYMATLEAISNQLTASWKKLAVAFGDAGLLDVFKLVTKIGTGIANIIGYTGGLLPLLIQITGVIAALKSEKIATNILSIGDSIKSVITGVKNGKKVAGAALGKISLIVAAIAAVVGAITALVKAGEQAREKLTESAKAAQESYESVGNLVSKYKELASESGGAKLLSSQLGEARDIQDQITVLTGEQASGLDLVNGNLDEEIAKLERIAQLNKAEAIQETADAMRAARAEMDKGIWNFDSNKFIDFIAGTFGYAADQAEALFKGVNKMVDESFELLGYEGLEGGKTVFDYLGGGSYEDAIDNLDQMIDVLQRAAEAADAQGIDFDNSAALAFLKKIRDDSKDTVGAFEALRDELYKLTADDAVKDYFDIVEATQESFSTYIATLRNPMATLFNEDGSVMSQEVRDALIEAAEKLFPDFASEADRAADLAEAFSFGLKRIGEDGKEYVATLEDITDEIGTLTEELDTAQSSVGTLMDIIDEYNETGIMSVDMLQQLIELEPEYLALLEFTADGLYLNKDATDSLVSSKEALIQKMIQLKAAEYAAKIESNYTSGVYDSAGAAASSYSGDLMSLINSAYSAGYSAETLASMLQQLPGLEGMAGSAALAMANDILTASRAMYALQGASSAAAGGLSSLAGFAGRSAKKSGGGGGGGGGEDPQVKILEARKKAIEEEADAQIAALKKVQEAEDRKRRRDEYLADKSEALADVRRAQSRSGIEAREDEADAEKKLAETNKDWQEQLQDWNLDDQIASIEEWKDAMVDAIDAQLDALKNAGGGGGGGGGGTIADVFANEAEVLTQNKDVLIAALLEMDNENLPEKIKAFYQLFDASQYTSDVDFSDQLAGIKTDWDTFTAENGDDWAIHYKMVLDDGTTMTPEQINDYINGLLGKATSESDLLKLDKEGLGILLRVTPDAETSKETEEQWSQTVNDLGQALTDVLDVLSSDDASFERVQTAIEDAFNEAFDAAEQAATDSGAVIEQQMAQAADDTGASMLSAVNGYSPQIVDAWNNNLINPMIDGLGDLSDTLNGVLSQLGQVAVFGGLTGIGGLTGTTSTVTQSQNNFFNMRGQGTMQINPLSGWMARLK